MENIKKKAKVWLCVAIILMLLSGMVSNYIQTDGGNVVMKELKLETDAEYSMSAYLFIPSSATDETPAPAIVTSHGYLNNKEMQDANYVELARRGFVVLAIDQPGHGNSDNITYTDSTNQLAANEVATSEAGGVYQGVLFLSRMSYVDKDRIGVTGHSMGGGSSESAVALDISNGTNLIAAGLFNSAFAIYTDENGNYANLYGSRDIAVLAPKHDEFSYTRVDEETGETIPAPYFIEGGDAQSFLNFGLDPGSPDAEVREADTIYTATIDGEEASRVIYNPNIIHPWSHFSATATASVIEFFTETLDAPNPIDPNSQVWQWKETFNFIGAIGLVIFIVCFGILMVYTPAFSSLRAKEAAAPTAIEDSKGKLWFWGCLIVSATLATVVYIPVVYWGSSTSASQTETMGLGLWSALCGIFNILIMAIYYFAYGKKNGFSLTERGVIIKGKNLLKSILLALIIVVVAYGCVFVVDYFFNSDFRLWTLAIKTFEKDKVWLTLTYMWLFLIYYIAASVSVNSFNYNTIGGKSGLFNNIIVSLFAAFPAIILPAIQYITYFSQDHMVWTTAAMQVLWLFPIILILFGANFMSRYLYKVTKNPYIAGIVNGVIVTIMTVTNTSTVFLQ